MRYLRLFLGVAGILLTYLLPALPKLAETDTCTMGGADGYLASTILALGILVLCAPAIFQLASLQTRIQLLLVGHLGTAVYFGLSILPVLWSTTLNGVHICGAAHGSPDPEQRLYAPVLLSILGFCLFWPVREIVLILRMRSSKSLPTSHNLYR